MARRFAELVAPDSARKPLGYPGMSSNRRAGGLALRYTTSASVPISRFQPAPRMRSSSPAASNRRSASRSGSCMSLRDAAEGVGPRHVRHIGDAVVAVHERAVEQPMLHAARLVLDLEELASVARIDDPLEAPLVGIGLHGDQVALLQPMIWAREVGDVDLDVVVVVLAQRLRRLREVQALVLPDIHRGSVPVKAGRSAHDLLVKPRDALGAALRH